METKDLIAIDQLCLHYKIEISLFNELNEAGLIELVTLQHVRHIEISKINDLEKMIRIHNELNVNIEGIDVVLNLLHKLDDLQNELGKLQNRLQFYETDQ